MIAFLKRRSPTPEKARQLPADPPTDHDDEPVGVRQFMGADTTLIFETPLEDLERTEMPPSSRLTPDMQFSGSIEQEGPMELLGQVDGAIVVTGQQAGISIGPEASLKGSASAAVIDVHGRVEGDLTGGSLSIHETAFTRGKFLYDRISILGGDNEINLKRRTQAT